MKNKAGPQALCDHVINECFLYSHLACLLVGWNTKWRRHHSTITTATVQHIVLVWTLWCWWWSVWYTEMVGFCFISWQFFRYNLKIVTSSSSSMLRNTSEGLWSFASQDSLFIMENILLSNLEFERDVIIYTDVKTEMVEPMQVSLLLTIEFVIL